MKVCISLWLKVSLVSMMPNKSSSKKDKVNSKKQTKGKKDKIQMSKKKRKRSQNKN